MEAALSLADWFKTNAAGFEGELRFDEPMARHTYYRIGGPAAVLAIPKSLSDLKWLARGIRETAVPIFVMGVGSNLLVSDEGFDGLVIKAARVNQEVEFDGTTLRMGSSVAISSLLRKAVQNGWAGLEFLTGVPGSVGGAVAMNAGTHLGETKDRIHAVEFFPLIALEDARTLPPDAEVSEFERVGAESPGAHSGVGVKHLPDGRIRLEGAALRFSYRKNHFLPRAALVWAAEWAIETDEPGKVKEMIDGTLSRRKSTQPIDYPSCGSVFKNPREHGLRSWEVMEKLGLRGHTIGGAQFSEKHPNFIINLGSAKAADVKALIELAKARAKAELGVSLEEEVKYLGF